MKTKSKYEKRRKDKKTIKEKGRLNLATKNIFAKKAKKAKRAKKQKTKRQNKKVT